jgi:catechol 2,3-dioxygenase-like lactoylglutathione lyase family enzyme
MPLFFLNDTRIFIHYRYPPQEDHHAFLVEDVDTYYRQLMKLGSDLEIPPQDYDRGRSAYVRDPDGRQIEITQKGN